MVSRLVSGGGAGRLLDEVGEGPGSGDHRPGSSREASRVSARTTSTCTGCTTPASTHTDRRNHRHTERPRARREDPLHRTLGHPAWAVAKAAVIADFRGWAPISS